MKQLIIGNGLSTLKSLDCVVIKKLSSVGDTIKGRLHGQREISLPLNTCLSNLLIMLPEILPRILSAMNVLLVL
jgi:hypothetical protein